MEKKMSDSAPKPIWLILPNQALVDLAYEAIQMDSRYGNLCHVFMADSVAGIPAAQHAINNGARAIVSRGGTASIIRQSFNNFPVIDIRINTPLIMTRYFDLARIHNDKMVVLFASTSFMPSETELRDFREHGYEVHCIHELFAELSMPDESNGSISRDLKVDFKKLVADYPNKLFIFGDASACRLASEYGVEFEEIKSSINDLTHSIDSAFRLLRTAFIGMSFTSTDVQLAHHKAMTPVLQRAGFNVLTQLECHNAGSIMQSMLDEIRRSSLILIDLTDEKPNCYYELGFAHGLGKNVIITARTGTKLHFDVSGERCIFWSNWNELSSKLSDALVALGYTI